jgi:hypothetical protein
MDYNLIADILLGLVMIVSIGFLYEMTSYMTFDWYIWIAYIPIAIAMIPIVSIVQISSLVKGEVKSEPELQNITRTKTDNVLSLFAALVFWLIPIVIEAGFASLAVFSKYKAFGSISTDDVYCICEIIPICLLLIPCLFVKLRDSLPKYTKSYIYDSMNIVGVATNILVLVFSGWLTVTAINT